MTFSTQWKRVFPEIADDSAAVNARVKGSREVLDPLREYLEKELANLLRQEEAPANYEKPGFVAQQADYIGQRRQLRKLIEMLTFDKEETA